MAFPCQQVRSTLGQGAERRSRAAINRDEQVEEGDEEAAALRARVVWMSMDTKKIRARGRSRVDFDGNEDWLCSGPESHGVVEQGRSRRWFRNLQGDNE
jgi:hypothetical protein